MSFFPGPRCPNVRFWSKADIQALTAFQRAAALEPGAVDTHVYLVEVYRLMGHQDAAEQELAKL